MIWKTGKTIFAFQEKREMVQLNINTIFEFREEKKNLFKQQRTLNTIRLHVMNDYI